MQKRVKIIWNEGDLVFIFAPRKREMFIKKTEKT